MQQEGSPAPAHPKNHGNHKQRRSLELSSTKGHEHFWKSATECGQKRVPCPKDARSAAQEGLQPNTCIATPRTSTLVKLSTLKQLGWSSSTTLSFFLFILRGLRPPRRTLKSKIHVVTVMSFQVRFKILALPLYKSIHPFFHWNQRLAGRKRARREGKGQARQFFALCPKQSGS